MNRGHLSTTALSGASVACRAATTMPLSSLLHRHNWDTTIPEVIGTHASPNSSLQDYPDGYVEWLPAKRSKTPICLFTVLTASHARQNGGKAEIGLSNTSWSTPVQLINLNWALARGYKYGILTKLKLAPHSLAFYDLNFHKLWMALFLLRRGVKECAYVFYVDADAIINNIETSVEERIIEPFFSNPNPANLSMVFSSHSFGGDEINGEGCRCNRATADYCDTNGILQQWDQYGFSQMSSISKAAASSAARFCMLNGGLFFLRNTPVAIEIMDFWAHCGRGVCPAHWKNPEQNCASFYLKPRWHREIDIVPGPLYNAPALYEPGLSRMEAMLKKAYHGRLAYANYSTCLRTTAFICHAYGTNATFRQQFFWDALEGSRHALLRLMRSTGQPFASLDDVFVEDEALANLTTVWDGLSDHVRWMGPKGPISRWTGQHFGRD